MRFILRVFSALLGTEVAAKKTDQQFLARTDGARVSAGSEDNK
jgi:hypothetical protein